MRLLLLVFIFSILLIFTAVIIYHLLKWQSAEDKSKILPAATSFPSILNWEKNIEIKYKEKTLFISYFEASKTAGLILIPNFKEKEFGEKIAETNNCIYAVNGGFYKGNAAPLGLFYSNGQRLGKTIKSNTANGFIYQDKTDKRFIERVEPAFIDGLDFVVQSGPYFDVGKYRLRTINDIMARRVLAGIDDEDRLYLLAIYNRENIFGGPYLSDLPQIFASEEVQEKIKLTKMINLDGGGASFFYAKEGEEKYSLTERQPVGSIICIKI